MQNRIAKETTHQQPDTFLIIRNCRKTRRQPTQSKRVARDYSQDKKSIILTRKMKAQLQGKLKIVNREQAKEMQTEERQEKMHNQQENSWFFNQNQLQRAIPFNSFEDRDLFCNQFEATGVSRQPKLEKAAFERNFQEFLGPQLEEELM